MAEDQKNPDGFVPNAARYREASKPYESEAAANEGMEAFFAELSELRVTHNIKDMVLVYYVAFVGAGGKESSHGGFVGFGNECQWEEMAAFAYGREKAKRKQRIGQLLGT